MIDLFNPPQPAKSLIKSTASGQFTFSGLKPGTKYSGTLSGWIETDEIDTATIGPVTDYATTLS